MKTANTGQLETQEWLNRPEPPIRYGLFDRCSDWMCASRDAKTGAPELLGSLESNNTAYLDVASDGEHTWATPRTMFLAQLGRGRAEKEWIRYYADISEFRIRHDEVVAERDAARQRLTDAQERLATLHPPAEADLASRVVGEDRTAPEVVAARRLRGFTEQQKGLQAQIERDRAALLNHEVELARLTGPMRVRRDVALTRIEMIDAYVRRRCAAYLTRLIRKHPDGRRIGSLVRSGWVERPSWASPDRADGIDLPGGGV